MKTQLENEKAIGLTDNLVTEKVNSILIHPSERTLQNKIKPDDELERTSELSGVFCNGIQYYDFQKITFINNMGVAKLIGLLKTFLEKGNRLQLVNVNNKIKEKIKAMGLDNVFRCK